MELAAVAEKVAANIGLTPEEMDFWKRAHTETQRSNSFVAGNVTAANLLNLSLPIETVFNEVLSESKSEISVEIPSRYNHLIMLFAGRSTGTGVNYDEIFGQFNDDTGSNYIGNQIQLSASTLSGVVGTAIAYFGVCVAPSADTVSGSSGGSFMFIPNIRSTIWKYCLNLQSSKQIGAGADTSMLSMLQSFWWKNTSPVTKIRVYANTNSIASGSNLTVLGIQ